mmetsp:Transcript_30754/g.80448  ORF Transcript_30754/g.80448 Transcript_30754/m.80448 type:complete len:203 (-) Transcript_30754:1853-2461(-)
MGKDKEIPLWSLGFGGKRSKRNAKIYFRVHGEKERTHRLCLKKEERETTACQQAHVSIIPFVYFKNPERRALFQRPKQNDTRRKDVVRSSFFVSSFQFLRKKKKRASFLGLNHKKPGRRALSTTVVTPTHPIYPMHPMHQTPPSLICDLHRRGHQMVCLSIVSGVRSMFPVPVHSVGSSHYVLPNRNTGGYSGGRLDGIHRA